ncbi:ATP-binding protein [Alkalisalibacterium limincola]|uniref:histidine kinase n=1 Tax=Alkalisalibacterium limincola TaxID=2699169 RepID=A0A5C8KWF7_9GAMM|nr:ATP-binding protein [Alkalisalibacterium limincola]TXK64960.1 HAMP domain-containing protein [Alkalisalibacterium limincola]
MRLRAKLLLVSLSLLVLPVTGWLFVRQMEGLMRAGEAQALSASAEALSRAVAQRPDGLPPAGPALFVQSMPSAPRLDGHADGAWRALLLPAYRFAGAGGQLDDSVPDALQLTLGRHEDQLYLFARVADGDRQPAEAHWPIAGQRDHLLLDVHGPQGRVSLRIANVGSGPVNLVDGGGGPPPLRVEGFWRETAEGYVVEMALPQGYAPQALALRVVDAGSDGTLRQWGMGGDVARTWPLLADRPGLSAPLAELLAPGVRGRIVDSAGWVMAQAGDPMLPEGAREVPWWRRHLYRILLSSADASRDPVADASPRSAPDEVREALAGRASSTWRRDATGERQWLSVAVPLRREGESQARGALVLERENPSVLLLADQALLRLLGLSLLAFVGSAGVIFLFAGRLSWRIRRLRDVAETALDRDGRVSARGARELRSESRDEVGDLARSFARLLDEVAGYGDYLQGLAGKLSHEINTPLAIVRGSLDNIDAAQLPEADRACVARARSGVDRLGTLVRQMSEATRIERAVGDADAELVDVGALVRDCAEGYRALLEPRALQVSVPTSPLPMRVAPDLVAQALDKLVDNARGFTPEDGWVRISLEPVPGGVCLAVANQGPPLPGRMHGKLFDSLVSVREGRGEGSHLGLGLYVVRLVAALHRGRAEASNLRGGEGVEFRMILQELV